VQEIIYGIAAISDGGLIKSNLLLQQFRRGLNANFRSAEGCAPARNFMAVEWQKRQ
jgi:hypothetical protein